MALIQINSITLPCSPAGQFTTTIEIALSGGSFVFAGNVATNPNGVFIAPFVIGDLSDDTCYDIRYTLDIEGANCPFVDSHCTPATTTTTTTSTSTTTTSTSTTTTTSTSTTTTSSTTTTTTCCYLFDPVIGIFECCPPGYTLSPDDGYCSFTEIEDPTIVQSGICVAISQNNNYSSTGTFLYEPGFAVDLTTGTTTTLLTPTLWKDTGSSAFNGPGNRNGVWVDTDCNGTKDLLTVGQILQFSTTVNSIVGETLYVGISGDNTYQLIVNGVTIVSNQNPVNTANFNIWHVIPVSIPMGNSSFLFKYVGDGTTTDSGAAIIYRNTKAQLLAATTEGDLDIIFQSQDLIGEVIDIATCNVGFNLDTSGGSGNYECVKVNLASTIDCINTTTSTTTTTTVSFSADLFGAGFSSGSACSSLGNLPLTLYFTGTFMVGTVLYTDYGLTSPLTGYSYIAWDGNSMVYNVNPATGQIISSTGITCI